MKNKLYFFIAIIGVLLSSCDNKEYNLAKPIYMTKEEFKSSIKRTSSQEIVSSGKVYMYNDVILINDIDKGIYVIDNSNSVIPIKVAFIEII